MQRYLTKLGFIVTIVGLVFFTHEASTPARAQTPHSASQFYDFKVVATTGQAGLTNIFDKVSINDFGNIAFTGQLSNGEAVFVWRAFNTSTGGTVTPPDLTNITSGLVRSAVTFAPLVQINNSNQVLAINRTRGFRAVPAHRRVRVWDGNAPGSNTVVAFGGRHETSPFFDPYDIILPDAASFNNSNADCISPPIGNPKRCQVAFGAVFDLDSLLVTPETIPIPPPVHEMTHTKLNFSRLFAQ